MYKVTQFMIDTRVIPLSKAVPDFRPFTGEESKTLKYTFARRFGVIATTRLHRSGRLKGAIVLTVKSLESRSDIERQELAKDYNLWLYKRGIVGGRVQRHMVEAFKSTVDAWHCWDDTTITLRKLK